MAAERSSIERQAAAWAVRVAAGPLQADSLAEFEAWLSSDVRHRGALVRAQAVWLDVDRVSALLSRDGHTGLPAWSQRPSRSKRPYHLRLRLAASLAAVALLGAGASWWVWVGSGDLYKTRVGEVRRVLLADGSSLLLDTATKARVHFSGQQRDVELLSGEALFEVAKDKTRPFVVHAGPVSVRAVGTVFGVRSLGLDVSVTVTEGVVEVAHPGSGLAEPKRVAARERAVVSQGRSIQVRRISSTQVERSFAWRDGMLSFDGESLGEAAKEFNRYSHRSIVIDDAELAARPVVGLFRSGDSEGFAETVAAALGAERLEGGDAIHIRIHGR